MSIFSTLHTGISGLNAAQVQISTTGHNITNANNAHYTRQRVIQTSAEAMHIAHGDIGMGTKVERIVRIHDEFVFNKLRSSSGSFEHTKYLKSKLEEAAQRFPDLKDVGILNDIEQYQKAWNNFASHPSEGSMKINLVQSAITLTADIKMTKQDLTIMQDTVNSDLLLSINELNRLGSDIAKLNAKIEAIESSGLQKANDLRDKRDELELTMGKLVNIQTFKENLEQNSSFDESVKENGTEYHLNIEGFSIVDGPTFHPLKISSVAAGSAFQKIYYEMQDGKTVDVTNKLSGGKIGAQLDLRGRNFNSQKGAFDDGLMQGFIDDLDSFAETIISKTNNIYAKAAQKQVVSAPIQGLKSDDTIMNLDKRIQPGSFDLVVYDGTGKEVSRKSIYLDSTTSMKGGARNTSLVEKINSNTDDNHDNNNQNDFDDYFSADYSYNENVGSGIFTIVPKLEGYKISLEDHGTNISGIFELGKFFEGKNASDIDVHTDLRSEPTNLRASSSGSDGNNDVANEMMQMQYEEHEFFSYDRNEVRNFTITGFYRHLTTTIASSAENNNNVYETNLAILENVTAEFQSVSGVDMNEELSNLMKYQASFGAAAKIISTVDRMLDTLLGLKQ